MFLQSENSLKSLHVTITIYITEVNIYWDRVEMKFQA